MTLGEQRSPVCILLPMRSLPSWIIETVVPARLGRKFRWLGCTIVVGVDDVDSLMRRGVELGGTEALAAADVQGVGRVGYLLDLDNNVFGLISAVMSDGTTGMGGSA